MALSRCPDGNSSAGSPTVGGAQHLAAGDALNSRTLKVDEILEIYDVLVRDFAEADDPIAPAGIRSRDLLESAVHRQHTGYQDKLKYGTAVLSAASLCYGICSDHVFFNGNKRIALVAMLVHLDRNELCLPDVTQEELFSLMLAVADHDLVLKGSRRTKRLLGRADSDSEVEALAAWLRKRTRRTARGERPIAYRQLRRILRRFGIEMEHSGSNSIDLVRYEEVKEGILFKRKTRKRRRITTIGYRNEGTVLSKSELKQIRRACGLLEADGVDSEMFYSTGEVIDAFVNRYRRVLRKLAKH
ncbi:MAG: type II toxin-antitoxin system death-on-curing family toxin [Pyrinomonadaceae bacterium]